MTGAWGEFNGTTVSSIKGAPTTGSLASKQADHKGTQTCDACLLTEKHTFQLQRGHSL